MNPLQNYLSSIKTPDYGLFKKKTTTPAVPTPLKPQMTPLPASMKQTNITASPAAAPTSSAQITPASTSPARSNYVASISSPTQTQGVQSPATNVSPTTSTAAVSGSAAVDNPKDAYLKSYRDYLAQYATSLKPSDETTAASTKLAEIQSKIDERKLKGDQEYQRKLDAPGMLKAGAQSDATQFARRENADLANLAVQESGAARSLDALTNARTAGIDSAKTLAEMNKPLTIGNDIVDPATGQVIGSTKDSSFTLSPGEVRYGADGKVIATGGPKPMSAAQEAAQIATTEKEKQVQQTATQSLSVINNLLKGDRYKAISGALQTGSVPFLGDRTAVAEYDQLQGLLKLGVRSLIKGQGAVSDYEGKVLGDASSALSRLTNESQMKEALQTVRGVIKTNSGQVTEVDVYDPDTEETVTANLSGDEIYQLVSEGATIKYK